MLESVVMEQETGTEKLNALYSEQELTKESQVSVRMEKGLYEALEAQTRAWNMKSVSQTVRAILTFYFLPVAYEIELKSRKVEEFKDFIKERQKEGYSLEEARQNYFLFQTVEYLRFLEQAKIMSKHSLLFMEKATERMNAILKEAGDKINQAIKELDREQEK